MNLIIASLQSRRGYQAVRCCRTFDLGQWSEARPRAFLRLITNLYLGHRRATPNAYFIAAKASTTGRLLTVIMPALG
jgi:hypothetical protein